MNIFFLSNNFELSAHYHHDKHVNKMIIEYAQILSTNHRVCDGEMYYKTSKGGKRLKAWRMKDPILEKILYKATHFNHPCTVWARQSLANYEYLYSMFVSLCDEYTYRFCKVHLTDKKLRKILKTPPNNIHSTFSVDPPRCMPEKYIVDNVVDSYRNFYIAEKIKGQKYTKRDWPNWIPRVHLPIEYQV